MTKRKNLYVLNILIKVTWKICFSFFLKKNCSCIQHKADLRAFCHISFKTFSPMFVTNTRSISDNCAWKQDGRGRLSHVAAGWVRHHVCDSLQLPAPRQPPHPPSVRLQFLGGWKNQPGERRPSLEASLKPRQARQALPSCYWWIDKNNFLSDWIKCH